MIPMNIIHPVQRRTIPGDPYSGQSVPALNKVTMNSPVCPGQSVFYYLFFIVTHIDDGPQRIQRVTIDGIQTAHNTLLIYPVGNHQQPVPLLDGVHTVEWSVRYPLELGLPRIKAGMERREGIRNG